MNNMERLYKRTFWSIFGGVAMVGNFAILPLSIIPIMVFDVYSGLRLSVFTAFCSFLCIGAALLFASVVPLYANVSDRTERTRRLVRMCRFWRKMMLYTNLAGLALFLWRKVFEPLLFLVGGWIVVIILLLLFALLGDETESE